MHDFRAADDITEVPGRVTAQSLFPIQGDANRYRHNTYSPDNLVSDSGFFTQVWRDEELYLQATVLVLLCHSFSVVLVCDILVKITFSVVKKIRLAVPFNQGGSMQACHRLCPSPLFPLDIVCQNGFALERGSG